MKLCDVCGVFLLLILVMVTQLVTSLFDTVKIMLKLIVCVFAVIDKAFHM